MSQRNRESVTRSVSGRIQNGANIFCRQFL